MKKAMEHKNAMGEEEKNVKLATGGDKDVDDCPALTDDEDDDDVNIDDDDNVEKGDDRDGLELAQSMSGERCLILYFFV